MAAVTVRLLDDDNGTSVFLNGTQTASGAPVALTSLVVQRSGAVETTLNVSPEVELPATVLAIDGSATQFRLKRPSTAFHSDITFTAVNPLFGITFDITVGVRVVLRLHLLPSSSEQPVWELLVSGGVKIGTAAGGATYSVRWRSAIASRWMNCPKASRAPRRISSTNCPAISPGPRCAYRGATH